MASSTQWTWVWANSGRQWRTGKPACCSPWGHKESDTTEQLATTSSSLRKEALTDGPNFTKFHYLADSCGFFILHTDRATDEITMGQTFTPSPHCLFPGSNSLPQLLDANLGPVTISGLMHGKQTLMLCLLIWVWPRMWFAMFPDMAQDLKETLPCPRSYIPWISSCLRTTRYMKQNVTEPVTWSQSSWIRASPQTCEK